MTLVGNFLYRERSIQSFRVPSNQLGYDATDGKRYQYHIDGVDRTDAIVAVLKQKGLYDGSWSQVAKDIVDEEEGPEITQTVTIEKPNVTKTKPTKNQGIIALFREEEDKRKKEEL